MSYRSNAKERENLLSVAGQKLLSRWNADVILSQVVEGAVKIVDGVGGALTLKDPEEGLCRCVAIYNLPEQMLLEPIRPAQSLASVIYLTGQPQVVDDYTQFPGQLPILSHLKLKSTVGVPLKVDEEVIGALVVSTTSEERRFGNRDLDMLVRFASMAAIAIQNARLHYENLQSMAQLAEAKRKLDQQARTLRLLLSRVFDAHEEERRRIAMGLHDSVVQSIVAAHMELSLAQQLALIAPSDAIKYIITATNFLSEAHTEIRGVIMNLRPARLDKDGLLGALDHLIKGTQMSLGLQCSFTVIGEPRSLDPSKEITVYRIVQEAIGNVWKHADATRLSLRIQFGQRRLVVVIEDNGKGFDITRVDGDCAFEHLGLVTMRERTESVGGTLSIDSRIGRGTLVRVTIPLGDPQNTSILSEKSMAELFGSPHELLQNNADEVERCLESLLTVD